MTNQVCTSENHLIGMVFKELEKQKLQYIVLRNYSGLPQDAGHDIDVLVKEDNLDDYETLLCETAIKQGWHLVQYAKRYGFRSFIFMPHVLNSANECSLKWDVWAPINWKGFVWIDTKVALSTRKVHQNGFYIPAPGVEAATLLLKEVLQYGKIKRKYLEIIRNYVDVDPENFISVLEKSFGKTQVSRLLLQVQQENWGQIEASHNLLRAVLINNIIKQSPVSASIKLYKFVNGHFLEFIRGRPHLFLCLIGPDGSGKSTISNEIIESISDIFEEKHYYHGHFGILPELSKFIPFYKSKEENMNESDSSKEYQTPNKFIASILMVYYAIDYIFGYAKIFRNRSKGNLIIFDRYFYDYIIQPSSFGINSLLFRVLSLLIPSPDLVIYLHSPSELIYTRKPELTTQEIDRQAGICAQLIRHLPNAYQVDNSLHLDQVIVQIREIVLEMMLAQTSNNEGICVKKY